MANLILKPSTGGVLKLQNDAGTVDALSVSTGGNLTAAGTLGVTGAVTASSTLGVTGNTTLSGTANNIGTTTAGTLSSGVTFPAGHVIGLEYMQTTVYKSYPNNTAWTTTNLTDTIDVKSQTSKILVLPKINCKVYAGAVSAYFRIDESTTSLQQPLDTYYGNGSSAANTGTACYQYLHDHNQVAGTTLTYTINMRPHTAHANGIRVNDHMIANHEVTSLVLMEIAQ